MEIITATIDPDESRKRVQNWAILAGDRHELTIVVGGEAAHEDRFWWHGKWSTLRLMEGMGVLPAYEKAFQKRKGNKIQAYLHDDVVIYEGDWDLRVTEAFEDQQVGVVGFGGALCHGSPELYKTPYNLQQLGRSYYFSNVDDAEEHGTRFDGVMEVAVLDGFALIVRRELLEKMGGWQPDKWPPHHIYDYRCCCEAHRRGYKVMLVGVRCHHLGGRTATRADYQEWCKTTKWGSDVGMHEAGHRVLYEEYRDVLPFRVAPSEKHKMKETV